MTRVGITGHQQIPADAIPYIRQQIRITLAKLRPPVEGFSSLADGADQLFARILLELGGRLHAVIPSENYESTFDDSSLAQYRKLREEASGIEQLPFEEPDEAAYDAAGRRVVENSDILLAVWDGKPARGRGGTADAVAYARAQHIRVLVIWPAGVDR